MRTGVAMTDGMGAGARAERMRRRKFWGVIGGLAAAAPGWVDWFAIPSGTRAKRVGLIHGVGNVVAMGLFGASWWFRLPDYAHPAVLPVGLGFAGAALMSGTAWLGGELVAETIREFSAIVPWRSWSHSFTLTGSHDTTRVRTLVGDDTAQVEVAAGLLLTDRLVGLSRVV